MAYIARNLVMRPLTGMGAVAAPSSQCTRPQVYAPYYDSCVDPCPAGQQYDDKGLCQPIPQTVAFGLTGDQLVLAGGAVLAAWLIFGKRKTRNPSNKRRNSSRSDEDLIEKYGLSHFLGGASGAISKNAIRWTLEDEGIDPTESRISGMVSAVGRAKRQQR